MLPEIDANTVLGDPVRFHIRLYFFYTTKALTAAGAFLHGHRFHLLRGYVSELIEMLTGVTFICQSTYHWTYWRN